MSEAISSISSKQTQTMAYVWAVVVLVLIAATFILLVLYLRPQADAAALIGQVMTALVPTIAGVLAYMKSQETHLSVNSQLDAWKKEFARMVRAEQTVKIADDKQLAFAEAGADRRTPAVGGDVLHAQSAPVPVVIVAPTPLKVEQVNKGE